MITGKVGDELTVEDGKAAGRQVGLNILASVKQELGTLDQSVLGGEVVGDG